MYHKNPTNGMDTISMPYLHKEYTMKKQQRKNHPRRQQQESQDTTPVTTEKVESTQETEHPHVPRTQAPLPMRHATQAWIRNGIKWQLTNNPEIPIEQICENLGISSLEKAIPIYNELCNKMNITKMQPQNNKREKNKMQAGINPTHTQYFVRDQYGIERHFPHFNPQTDDQIRYIVRARNITIIRKTPTETKEFTPQSHINLQAAIINSFEILHATHEWINIEMIRQHLATLQIDKNNDELLSEMRNIYKLAKTKANKVICQYRKTLDGETEFQIKLLTPA